VVNASSTHASASAAAPARELHDGIVLSRSDPNTAAVVWSARAREDLAEGHQKAPKIEKCKKGCAFSFYARSGFG